MTSKPPLYGAPPSKSIASTKDSVPPSLAFSSTLSSLLAASASSAPKTGRPRPSKAPKESLFTIHNKGSKKRALADISTDDALAKPQSHAKNSEVVDAATLHRSKRKMEEKARLYASMKRGDYVPPKDGRSNKEENALVDFDRKWAESQEAGGGEGKDDTSSGDDDDVSEEEMVDYEDEFGRQRRGTKMEVAREMRMRNAQIHAADELSQYSARPSRPTNLIYGDTVQTAAFNPDNPTTEQMESLARKRDRSMTPPEETHYDASKEVRSKGVGFFNFSRDGDGRKKEMEALGKEREETERGRREREERKEKRRREVEERKRVIGEKRAGRLAEAFLDGL